MAPLGGNVVLFGGEDSTGLLQDTFIWNGTDWSAPTPGNKPTARKYHAMAPLGGNVVLFGGEDATGMLQDTWVWDGTTWNAQSPASSPTARRYHAMASLGGNIVLFGGEDSTGMLQDTWVWDGATWNAQSPATSPPARKHHTMAYNSSLGRVVLMGGEGASGRMDDTWAWDGTNWNQLPKTSTSPVARRYHASAYDGARGKVVIFGGDGASGRLGDTWKWGDGVGARPAGVIQVDFSPFGMDPAAALQSVTAGFYAGGVGHSSGVETNGADLVSWDRGQWKTVATNQYAPGSPGPVSWTTSDAALMPHLFYGPLQNLLIFGVIPSAPDDTGAGKVSVDYAEVRVQYRLP
jgi:hypothetical protein